MAGWFARLFGGGHSSAGTKPSPHSSPSYAPAPAGTAPSRFYRTVPTDDYRQYIEGLAREDAEKGIPAHNPPPQPPRVGYLLRSWAPDAMDRDLRFRQEVAGLLETIRKAGGATGGASSKGPSARRRSAAEQAISVLSTAVSTCQTDINTIGQMALLDVEIYRSAVCQFHERGGELAEKWKAPDLGDILPAWVARPTDEVVEALLTVGLNALGHAPTSALAQAGPAADQS